MENIFAVEKFLAEELNLSKKEITLYFSLLKYGSMSVLELSELTGINRATTHVNIDYLMKKNLVNHIKKGRGSRRLIMAEPLEKMALIFAERKMKLEAAENQLGYIVKELSDLKKEIKKEDNMEIRRYIGKKEVRLIYDEVLKANEIRTYADGNEVLKIFPANLNKFINAHKKNPKMFIWEIMENSDSTRSYVKQMNPKRFFYRLAVKKLALSSIDHLIFDGKIAMVEVTNGLVAGILIENSNLYESAKAIHKFVWSCLPDCK